ncbi:hypothetical protein CsSME_00007033 [Camellia sinensis var. sinensis]
MYMSKMARDPIERQHLDNQSHHRQATSKDLILLHAQNLKLAQCAWLTNNSHGACFDLTIRKIEVITHLCYTNSSK